MKKIWLLSSARLFIRSIIDKQLAHVNLFSALLSIMVCNKLFSQVPVRKTTTFMCFGCICFQVIVTRTWHKFDVVVNVVMGYKPHVLTVHA